MIYTLTSTKSHPNIEDTLIECVIKPRAHSSRLEFFNFLINKNIIIIQILIT